MNYDKRLSIIVPVYNVEEYLERCVDSLLDQDLLHEEYEIILINDGSTDNSYEIAKRLAGEHDNIVLFTQENQGLSGARNTGLDNAAGEFVMFVDSDDMLLKNVLLKILHVALKNKLDVCACRMIYCDADGFEHMGAIQPFPADRIFDGRYAITHGVDIGSVCLNMYSRKMIENNHLRFLDGIYHEDVDFNLRVYAYIDRIMFVDTITYCYCFNKSSISRITNKAKAVKHIMDDFIIVRHIRDFSEQDEHGLVLKCFYQKHGNSLLVSRLLYVINNKLLSKEEKVQLFEYLITLGLYPIKGRTLSWKTTFLIPFLNIKRLIRFMF